MVQLKRALALLTFLLGLALPVTVVWAQETTPQLPFVARVNATYTVLPDATTRVKHEIRLRNTTSVQFARQYALQVNSPDVADVVATGADGKTMPIDVSRTPLQTILSVQFPDDSPVVGRDQERLFSIEFTSKDAASRYGEVLEVTIPRLADPEFYEQYSVTLIVPESYGEPAWIQPEQYTVDRLNGAQVVRFTDVAKSGVSALFGQEQVYDLNLRYHVSNPSQNPGVVEVALPPDTAWQQVWYESISPEPQSLRIDSDGNWIAQFRLAGEASQQILAKGQITVFAQPNIPVSQTSPLLETGKSPWWAKTEASPWLQSNTFWPTDHPMIQEAVQKNTSARSIYDFVVETLQYNSERARTATRVERLGPIAALQDPGNALCQEYTDVFITMARAAGIPARRVTGYAVNQDSALRPLSLVADTLHAWPEYFDVQQGRWVPIDPTWSDTTGGVEYFQRFDMRHIVFARQGVHDSLPLAAGQYKEAGQEAQDVEVAIATTSAVPAQAEVDLRLEPAERFPWPGQPRRVKVTVQNKSGIARYNMEVKSAATGAALAGMTDWKIDSLLPYQTLSAELELSGADWLQAQPAQVTATLDTQTTTYDINVRRAIQDPILRAIALGGCLAFLSFGAGSVSILGLRRLRPVRRKSKKS